MWRGLSPRSQFEGAEPIGMCSWGPSTPAFFPESGDNGTTFRATLPLDLALTGDLTSRRLPLGGL